MTWTKKSGLAAVLALIGIAAFWMASATRETAEAAIETKTKSGSARYTVVATEGHNLLVTDNTKDKLYFYTIDKDKPIGSPLKLRASLDLTKVGKEEINITPHNVEKVEKPSEKPEK